MTLISKLLHSEIQDFIHQNVTASLSKLALQKNCFPDVEWIEIVNQIASKTKAKDKLPTWFGKNNIVYPLKVSIEQTSSEHTALYKSNIVYGENLIDLTGGFGVDAYYFSKKIKNVIHCEISAQLSEIVKHNFAVLDVKNIQCYAVDGLEILKSLKKRFDWIYIDPSRRNESKGKVFMLKDCLPDVPNLLDVYFNYSNNILIKTAPILDLSAGINELKNVKKIHIVAVDNEVKELLWEIEKGYLDVITIKTINIQKNVASIFEFVPNQDKNPLKYALPQKYLYEPNAAIMKSGGFEAVGITYNILKLHQHSHLYTSNQIIDFPGRGFEIINSFMYHKTEMKLILENKKINITTRNFPETVENIRKKWKIKDGGSEYCFFTTDVNNNKIVLICTKI